MSSKINTAFLKEDNTMVKLAENIGICSTNNKNAHWKESSLRDLCANCELRKTCILPKPEGGIWHCEEYE